MVDPRVKTLAKNLVNFSCRIQPGEGVLIEAYDGCYELVEELVREAYAAGGLPHVWLRNSRVNRALAMGCAREQLELDAKADGLIMENMKAYIGVRGSYNTAENKDVPPEKNQLRGSAYSEPVHGKIRVPKTKWCVLRYPSPSMAQAANMSTEAFENYYFNVCCLDYSKMDKAMDPLVALMERTDKVHIVGPGTDLTFSIKGLPAIKCAGEMNIPDGEVFSAPVAGSINGRITFNTPALFEGFTYENVCLTYRDGRLVDATANDTERVRSVFERDEGAKAVGEFAIGVNPYVTSPMKDTLFDEKIAGSFHFTPGACYDECDNGNK
ncbi:MAG TPA: aminopeptidase, partial [Clostridia bacterium]|nr:aminopeptidase [Clostridia bacterium]